VAFSAVGDGGRRPREHDYLERWCGGSAHALSRCARFARMDSCDPLLATHLNPFDCASHAFGWRVGPGTLPPLPLPPLNRADERSDFGLYSHQSRPWLNTPAAWLTRLETPLALVGALRCDGDHKNVSFETGAPERTLEPITFEQATKWAALLLISGRTSK